MLRDSVANRLTSVQRHLGLEFRFLSVALSYQAAQLAVVLASVTYVPELFFLHHLTRTTGSAKACLLGLRFTLETGRSVLDRQLLQRPQRLYRPLARLRMFFVGIRLRRGNLRV